MKKLLCICLLLTSVALGQSGGSTPVGVASSVIGGTLPATCTVKQVFIDTTTSPAKSYVCLSTNVYTQYATGTGFSCAGCTVNTISKTSGAGTLADSSIGDNGSSVSPIVDNTVPLGDLTHRFSNGFFGGVIKWTNGAGAADLGLSRDINAGNTLDLGTGAPQNATAQLNLAIINNPNGALDIFGTNASGIRVSSTGGGTIDLQGNGFIRWGNGNASFNGPDVSIVRVSPGVLGINTGSFPGSAGSLNLTNLNATSVAITGGYSSTDALGNALIQNITAQTTQRFIRMATTGGNLYVGVDDSAGGFFGTTGYNSVWYSPSNDSVLKSPNVTFTGNAKLTGKVLLNNNIVTAGIGDVPVYGATALTAQSATVGPTTLYAATPVGTYRVCFNAYTIVVGTGVSGTVTISWNDGAAKAFVSSAFLLSASDITGQVNGCQVLHSAAAQNITYTVTVAAPGTSTWGFDATAEQLR